MISIFSLRKKMEGKGPKKDSCVTVTRINFIASIIEKTKKKNKRLKKKKLLRECSGLIGPFES